MRCAHILYSACTAQAPMHSTGTARHVMRTSTLQSACVKTLHFTSTLNPHLDPAVSLRQDLQPSLAGQVLGDDHAVLAALIVHLKGEEGMMRERRGGRRKGRNDDTVLVTFIVHLKGEGEDVGRRQL